MLRKCNMLVSLLCLLPALVFAQNTGKIAGVVTDRGTGDPLPGATVRIVETNSGTSTKVDGSYFIIGVPVGTYTVSVSYVGYGTVTKTNVQVSAGYTRTLDIALVDGVELEDIEVVARPLIQKDAIGDPKVVGAEQLQNLPVRGANAVLNVQGGVAADDRGDSYARGGRNEDIVYYIDGVRTTGSVSLPQSSVQEQEMLIGNISAKYGDVLSGVVNITTKAAPPKYSGTVEALSSQFLDAYGYNGVEATVGGPLVKNKLGFLLSASFVNRLDENPSWGSYYTLPDSRIDQVLANPQGIALRDNTGNFILQNGVVASVPFPVTNLNRSTLVFARDASGAIIRDAAGNPQVNNNGFVQGTYVLANASGLERNATGIVVRNSGAFGATTGIAATIPVAAGQNVTVASFRSPLHQAALVSPSEYVERKAVRRPANRLILNGRLDYALNKNMILRLGTRHNNLDRTGEGTSFMNNNSWLNFSANEANYFATLNHNLSSNTFYQLVFSRQVYDSENYSNLIGNANGLEDLLRYGDIDDAANVAMTRYRRVGVDTIDTDNNGSRETAAYTFESAVKDGNFDATTYSGWYTYSGVTNNLYEKRNEVTTSFSGSVTTQTGIHQLEIGGDYFKEVKRYWGLAPRTLAGYYRDCNAAEYLASHTNANRRVCLTAENQEIPSNGGTSNSEYWNQSLGSWSDLTFAHVANQLNYYYGYSFDGTRSTDTQNVDAFGTGAKATGAANITQDKTAFDVAPWSPVALGGYIQDKIEYKDLVINLGLRLDVFDNNVSVLKDQYSLVNIERAGTPVKLTANGAALAIANKPSNIGDDFAVYRNNSNGVVGYRDLDGYFYNETGTRLPLATGGKEIRSAGNPTMIDNSGVKVTGANVSEAAFTDYKPQVSLMPRIGVSFPITDKALFFARYGVVSQRPSQNSFISLMGYYDVVAGGASARINNPNLKPQRAIEYELGYKQTITDKQAVTVSGFIRQLKDLIALRDNLDAFPVGYTTYKNVDFAYVKGIEARYDMRRTKNLALNVNYTLSYADGTGSDATTMTTIAWLSGFYPNFVSRTDFDQRHKLNASADYRFGKDGPKVLNGFGVNLLYTFGTGFAYTGRTKAYELGSTSGRTIQPEAEINNRELPSQQRLDLKIDRTFAVSASKITAFLEVNNLLNTRNVRGVNFFTGLADEDAWFNTEDGLGRISNSQNGGNYAYEQQYLNQVNTRDNYSIPRQMRLGLRLTF
jgi:TonB dependent receptor/Carboxypeptidase regulatory-like domain